MHKQVFFKMDRSGEGEEIELKNLALARELSFIGFTHDMFREVRWRCRQHRRRAGVHMLLRRSAGAVAWLAESQAAGPALQ